MSTKLKVKICSVSSKSKNKSKAKVRTRNSSVSEGVVEKKNCGFRENPAVEAMQLAGKDLSEIFGQLKDERIAAKLVRAIRDRDARAVQKIIDFHCRVIFFFHVDNKDCVRIRCSFGRNHDVTVTFDICIKREHRGCHFGC